MNFENTCSRVLEDVLSSNWLSEQVLGSVEVASSLPFVKYSCSYA